MGILKQKKKVENRVLSIRIANNVYAEVEEIKAAASAAGFEFDVQEICADALSKACKVARAELQQMSAKADPV